MEILFDEIEETNKSITEKEARPCISQSISDVYFKSSALSGQQQIFIQDMNLECLIENECSKM